jgi:uncharacterized protein YkwD
MQQRAHPPPLQVFLHLPGATTARGSRLRAALAGALLACLGALAAGTAAAATAPPECADANLRPTVRNLGAVDAATLCLVNRERTTRGLHALHANRQLGHAAEMRVGSMVHNDYYADVGPAGQTPLVLVAISGYRAHAAGVEVGQNIAWGTGSDTTPAHIVQEWMASLPHREIMLSSEYRDAGVASTSAVPAVLHTRGRGATYAIEFGARL